MLSYIVIHKTLNILCADVLKDLVYAGHTGDKIYFHLEEFMLNV